MKQSLRDMMSELQTHAAAEVATATATAAALDEEDKQRWLDSTETHPLWPGTYASSASEPEEELHR